MPRVAGLWKWSVKGWALFKTNFCTFILLSCSGMYLYCHWNPVPWFLGAEKCHLTIAQCLTYPLVKLCIVHKVTNFSLFFCASQYFSCTVFFPLYLFLHFLLLCRSVYCLFLHSHLHWLWLCITDTSYSSRAVSVSVISFISWTITFGTVFFSLYIW